MQSGTQGSKSLINDRSAFAKDALYLGNAGVFHSTIGEDNSISANSKPEITGEIVFKCFDVTLLILEHAQCLSQALSRFGSEAKNKVANLIGDVDLHYFSSRTSSGMNFVLPDL